VVSEFLKKRLPRALTERAGLDTVQCIPFDDSSVDSLTGDIDESVAYNSTPVSMSALVDLSPSKAMREKVGLEQNFDAALLIAKEHLDQSPITLKNGDAFILPSDSQKFYVNKIVPSYQAGDQFIVVLVAVGRKKGMR